MHTSLSTKGKMAGPKVVLYLEVPLYVDIIEDQLTLYLASTCRTRNLSVLSREHVYLRYRSVLVTTKEAQLSTS